MRSLDLLDDQGHNELDNMTAELCLKVAEELSQKLPAPLGRKLWAAVDQDFDSIYPILYQRAEMYPIVQTLRKYTQSPQGDPPKLVVDEARTIIVSALEMGQREANVEGHGPWFSIIIRAALTLLQSVFSDPLIGKLDPFYLYAVFLLVIQDSYGEAAKVVGDRRLFWPYEDTGLPLSQGLPEEVKRMEGFRPRLPLKLTPDEEAVFMTQVNEALKQEPLKAIEETYGVQLEAEQHEAIWERACGKIQEYLALARLAQQKSCQEGDKAKPEK
jgi:hypothetical protein